MARILAMTTHSTDDPTRCSLAFVIASNAAEAGKEVAIALLADAVYLAKEAVANSIQGIGTPKFSDLVKRVIDAGVPVYL